MSTSNRVMITDDALFMRVTLKNLLINSGYDVVAEAVNGKDAVERYKALKPDVVFMDITMPEMEGIAATRAIKESDPNARVIMCTAMGQKHLVIEAIQAGAKDFIVKPFSPERVLESIEKVIG
jgi:two-component system chemotaxis response regulator CheY